MSADAGYYQPDLAWIHHTGYSHHVEHTCPGILKLLRDAGLPAGAHILDVGCGSGLLARKLIAAGYSVHGVDASPAMIELARAHAPGATFDVVRLPTRLPLADAVVSTGHVLNYLNSRDDIARALAELAQATRPGAVLALDLITERFVASRDPAPVHAKVEEDWAIVTRYSRPAPDQFDRHITGFRRVGETWRRSDEHHRNVIFDSEDALRVLREQGIDAQLREAFGDEQLPEGLVVLNGVRR